MLNFHTFLSYPICISLWLPLHAVGFIVYWLLCRPHFQVTSNSGRTVCCPLARMVYKYYTLVIRCVMYSTAARSTFNLRQRLKLNSSMQPMLKSAVVVGFSPSNTIHGSFWISNKISRSRRKSSKNWKRICDIRTHTHILIHFNYSH